jgi:hypothetical protein
MKFETAIDLQGITTWMVRSIIAGIILIIAGVFALIIMLIMFTCYLLGQLANPAPTIIVPIPTTSVIAPCRDYPSNFIGSIRPCDTRGGKHEVDGPPAVAPTR